MQKGCILKVDCNYIVSYESFLTRFVFPNVNITSTQHSYIGVGLYSNNAGEMAQEPAIIKIISFQQNVQH